MPELAVGSYVKLNPEKVRDIGIQLVSPESLPVGIIADIRDSPDGPWCYVMWPGNLAGGNLWRGRHLLPAEPPEGGICMATAALKPHHLVAKSYEPRGAGATVEIRACMYCGMQELRVMPAGENFSDWLELL